MNISRNVLDNTASFEKCNIVRYVILYIAIALIFIALRPWIFSSDWISSSDFHACIEISSSFIAIIAAIACLIYYFGLKSRYYLIIGLGFFVCGSEDFIHGILSFRRLFENSNVDFSHFIPGTYVAGRIMLAVAIISAALLKKKLTEPSKIKKEAIIFSAIAILLGSGATALAFSLPLPEFIHPENIISRPVDLVSAGLFLAAFLLVFKQFISVRDVFSGTLLVCILLNLGGQIYMSFSKQLFDIFFDLAHWANILSYCMPVIGITFESLDKMKKAQDGSNIRKLAEEEIQAKNQQLRTANRQLIANELELEKTLKTLETKNKELQSIVYVASHDLKSPIVNINGFGNLLWQSCEQALNIIQSKDVSSDEKIEKIEPIFTDNIYESLEFISAGTRKSQSLLDGLLKVSRIGNIHIDIHPLNMNRLISDIKDTVEYQLSEKNIEMTVEQLPDCLGDSDQINQVFSNLIDNAIKYRHPDKNGKINVSAKTENGYCTYCVEDNGIGIKHDHQKKVFELFHRLNPSSSEDGEGIGLTIISRILSRHDGHITVESKPGENSKFYVTLPSA